jgi:hypothetical protein
MSSLFISAKDVSKICNCTERTSYKLLRTIKDSLSKQKHQKVTWEEFAIYEGVPLDLIEKYLKK